MKKKYERKKALRQLRFFSESIKKQVVQDIEGGKCTVLQACRELQVSEACVYYWVHKYSRYLQKNKILIVEEKSEVYRSKELEKRVVELEACVGRKQMKIDLLEKVIDIANEFYKTDLKKNFSKMHSNGLESIKASNTGTK